MSDEYTDTRDEDIRAVVSNVLLDTDIGDDVITRYTLDRRNKSLLHEERLKPPPFGL